MTFQEAQKQFSNIASSITAGLTSGELVHKQKALNNLLDRLPHTAEFDPIANAITEFSPKVAGQVTQAVLASLQSRDTMLQQSSALLTQASITADADARTLRFVKPVLIMAALTQSITTLDQIRSAAKAGNAEEAAAKAEALIVLLQQAQRSIEAV